MICQEFTFPEFGFRVLLVEDNPDHVFVAMTVIKQVLGNSSEIIVAVNAAEAIDLVHHFTPHDRPDLILIDLRLPLGNGFGVLEAARTHEASSGVPVFVVTSSMFDRDVAMSYEMGASAVLNKPLSRAALREELKRIGALRQ
jgi:CheY-like chemotaxis protein